MLIILISLGVHLDCGRILGDSINPDKGTSPLEQVTGEKGDELVYASICY